MGLDIEWARWLNEWAQQSAATKAVAVFCAEPLVWVMLACYVSVFVFVKRGWVREFLSVSLGAVMVYAANLVISLWWYRPRPFLFDGTEALVQVTASSKSFPSDHASIAFFFAYLLVAHKRNWWPAYITAALVALGRVAVGVHYPLDVMAGVAVGVAFGYLTIGVERLFGPLPNGAENRAADR